MEDHEFIVLVLENRIFVKSVVKLTILQEKGKTGAHKKG